MLAKLINLKKKNIKAQYKSFKFVYSFQTDCLDTKARLSKNHHLKSFQFFSLLSICIDSIRNNNLRNV